MQAAELVADNIELVSLPEVCDRVQDLADDPHVTAVQMGRVLSQDTALTGRLLKLVNSARYGRTARIETASRAISVLGLAELRNLALAASAAEMFAQVPDDLVDMVTFWKHSVYCALVAKQLAASAGVLHPERLFVAGLLHDVGLLLILTKCPEQAREILDDPRYRRYDPRVAEQAVLGFDHADVGRELACAWRLSEPLQATVGCHHDPGQAGAAALEAALVHIANAVTHHIDIGCNDIGSSYYDPYRPLLEADLPSLPERLPGLDPKAWELARISPTAIGAAVRAAAENFESVLNIIYPLPSYL